jgi:His-Xaa-Ser system protein HxsD
MKIIPSVDITSICKLQVSRTAYSVKNVENAIYRFTGFASFSISLIEEFIIVEIEKLPNSELAAEDVYHLLKNELISESLRQKIADETENERNLILAYTFSNTELVK